MKAEAGSYMRDVYIQEGIVGGDRLQIRCTRVNSTSTGRCIRKNSWRYDATVLSSFNNFAATRIFTQITCKLLLMLRQEMEMQAIREEQEKEDAERKYMREELLKCREQLQLNEETRVGMVLKIRGTVASFSHTRRI